MKVLHNVNTMKREQLYLQKVNFNLFINLVIIQNVTSRLHAIVQVVEKEPNYQKQNGNETLFSHRGSHPRLQVIKILAILT
jgi:hypothetical protein